MFTFLSSMRTGNTEEGLQAGTLAPKKTWVWVLDPLLPKAVLVQITELVLSYDHKWNHTCEILRGVPGILRKC